ncbi:F-box protein At5g03100-like [Chenopodium quinoa]|uniref:F-box protein At5g03100-like n=1 Tax=Chenopodium quinoa TaxID=63459 RepID=UPI000B77ECA5|nr:F-box protein At5g03100-like [Chenopodium quinoa]
MPPKQKRKLNIDLNKDPNEDDESGNVDLISGLPDDVLILMLSLVDIKTAGRSSLVSKRWRHLWTNLMDLDFDNPETSAIANAMIISFTCASYGQPEMDNYVKCVNQVINASGAPYLKNFSIHFPLGIFYAAHIENWVRFSLSKKVRNLEINLMTAYSRILFSNIITTNPAMVVNTTLESLLLSYITIDVPLLEWVLSNCVNLQRLSLHCCKTRSHTPPKHPKLVVTSLKLKHLEIFSCFRPLNIQALHIFAPNLTSFVFFETIIDVEYHNVTSLVDASFGRIHCRHIFHNLDILSGFSSQLEKLSIEWSMVRSASGGFPTFVNVKQLEVFYCQSDGECFSLASLIEACPLLHTFKLKLPLYRSLFEGTNSAPKDAQVNAIRSHQHLKTIEYVGYGGCASASKLALFLTWHASMVSKFIFDPHRPLYVGKRTSVYSSVDKDKLKIARSSAELLAKQIRRGIDVVIL